MPAHELKRFRSFEELWHYLLQSMAHKQIAILQALTREKLDDFKIINDITGDFKLLLVLPDREQQTIFLAHQLHPRYIAYADSNLDDLASVLQHILRRQK